MKKLLYILLFVPLALFGQDNYSLSFDGLDDYVSLPQLQPSVLFPGGKSTLIINYKGYGPLFSGSVSTPPVYPIIYRLEVINNGNNNAEIKTYHRSNDLAVNQEPVTESFVYDGNSWNTLIVAIDNLDGVYTLYNNGELLLDYTFTPSNFSHTSMVWEIGHLPNHSYSGGDHFFNGQIDNVKIFDNYFSISDVNNYLDQCISDSSNIVYNSDFNEGSGNILNDLSGNGNHGVIHGATFSEDVPEQNCDLNTDIETVEEVVDIEESQNNYSLDFGTNCSGEYTSSIHFGDVLDDTNSFSVGGWLYHNGCNLSTFMEKTYFDLTTNLPWGYYSGWDIVIDNNDMLEFELKNLWSGHGVLPAERFKLTVDATIPQNQWTHIVGVFEAGNRLSLYVNGQLIDEIETTVEGLINNEAPFRIGSYHNHDNPLEGGWSWDGKIDNSFFYDRSLSQTEVSNIYECSSLNSDGLMAYWNFNEGSGNTVYDLSGNENHGTIYGATYSEDVPEQNCNLNTNIETFEEEQLNIQQILDNGFTFGGIYNDSYYFVSELSDTWTNSDSICNSLGGNLVVIETGEENQFIIDSLNLSNIHSPGLWIGLRQNFNSLFYSEPNGGWEWVNGVQLTFNENNESWNTYQNWNNNEPSNGNTDGETYANIWFSPNPNEVNGTWNDWVNLANGLSQEHWDNNGLNFILEVKVGCTDSTALNYNLSAKFDDGSCVQAIYGCSDSLYFEFNSEVNVDDGSCDILLSEALSQLNLENINLSNTIEQATTSISSLQQALDTWNTKIDLSSGWNMFGYGCPSPIDVAQGLSNYTEIIIITKDNNGNVYMPEFGFNGIGDFTPGFGYQIKLTEAIEDFSLCDWYVNDIPEDNIVSLQEENTSLQDSIISMHNNDCIQDGYCYFDNVNQICISPEEGFDCEGNLKTSLSFNGIDEYILVSNVSLPYQNNDRSILFHSKHTSNSNAELGDGAGNVISYGLGCSQCINNRFSVLIKNDSREIEVVGQSNDINTGVFLDSNTWTHIAVILEESVLKIYKNGLLEASFNNSYNTAIDSNLFIGKNTIDRNDEYLGANLSHLQIWDKALSVEEIQTYKNCFPNNNEEGIVGYWKFNEGEGNIVYDISSNENHGIINGASYSIDVPESICD